MKNYTPLDGLRWSRDSDSALNNMPQTDVLGRAVGFSLATDKRSDNGERAIFGLVIHLN